MTKLCRRTRDTKTPALRNASGSQDVTLWNASWRGLERIHAQLRRKTGDSGGVRRKKSDDAVRVPARHLPRILPIAREATARSFRQRGTAPDAAGSRGGRPDRRD